MHTLLHFGAMLAGTALPFGAMLQALHTSLRRNFTDTAYTTVLHFGPSICVSYYLLEQCLQTLHFGPMLLGTAYYLMEQRLHVLQTDLWSNLTDAVNTNFFWTTAHRYCICLLEQKWHIQHTFFWAFAQRYCIIPHKVKLQDSANYLLEHFFQIP